MKPDICIYHAPCADGFTAAWAIWKRWPDIEFRPGSYSNGELPDVAGKHVLLVDYSFKRPVLEALAKKAASITIVDHHKSAMEDLAQYRVDKLYDPRVLAADGYPHIQAFFDMDKSGAMLAWEYAHPGEPAPLLVRYVQDRDLWKFEMKHSREVAANLFSYPYDFAEWSYVAKGLEDAVMEASFISQGAAIERRMQKDILALLEETTREMVIGGVRVPVANVPYTMGSDAGNIMSKDKPFAATYYDGLSDRIFSLRSADDGMDVSQIAVKYGGGGHARASGFRMPIGWEGDDIVDY